ncbi:Z1 domain-containing protein [Nocardia cyriacigeorgica]|uniref:Z1 domain-containing protein n=1 Tax=Nocardia cyriacigeorgica TaxID=135487 RepID=UPI0018962DB4|nr:Z1 domain-containing protein [Nocardia cyriacigeorgica]MBF6081148.1 Z1 domain-containing protein [Nocardia cyriacigeorgica]
MSDLIDEQYDVFKSFLDKDTPAEAVKKLALFAPPEVIQRIQERYSQDMIWIRDMQEPRSVVIDNYETWYAGPHPDDRLWPAITKGLLKQGWPQTPAIDSLDASSTRIVSLLRHPRESSFSTRGLVVGYVQSGKTTNFTAVMAKAADRGYKLFIVLAGIHNGLRRQTQARLIQQLVEPNPSMWSQITDLDHDFRPTANPASFFGKANKTHVLCVVKKNATVLRKLVKWLSDASDYLSDCPALIIDDEADQATVATASINPLIRQILDTLPKSAYVGYTASPFANLLIDPSAEDLYPQHFIVNLPKPEGHFGTEVLFGRYALDGEDPNEVDDGYDMIRNVPDDDVEIVRPKTKADADGFVPVVTDTLRRAVQYFWLTTAARRVRGTGNPHCTMLIHTSVRTAVHNSFYAPLEGLRARTIRELDDVALHQELKQLWETETSRVPAESFGERAVPFDEVIEQLPRVLRDCRIVMDNSESTDRLDYENGPVVAIAVGGNTLSRGLTLEGLSVSYFVRSVSTYDTLLQMGRWFGYRNGYADLPRIWMTAELEDWFRHIATVETEMRRDIDVYMTEGKTPMNFAVRLRTHPALRVTAAAKMKDAVTAASSYGGKRVQTRYFRTDPEWLLGNQTAARKLVTAALGQGCADDRSSAGRYLIRDVPSHIVLEFLEEYEFHEKSLECNADLISGYIEKRIRNAGSLRRWNIAIIGNPPKDADDAFEFAPGVSVGRIVRSRFGTPQPDFADIKTLMSRRDAAIDLDGDIDKMTEDDITNARAAQLPDTGLVVLYPIDRTSEPAPAKQKRTPLDAPEHVIGVGMVFPKPEHDSTVAWESTYISADLSGVDIEEEDFSLLEAEEL